MLPKFGIERERHNKLYYKSYENDNGSFHFHSQIEMYFVDDGNMEVIINNHRKILKKGEMSVALSFEPHAYRTIDFSKSSVLIIPPYICEEFVSAIKHKKATYPFVTDQNTVAKIKQYYEKITSGTLNDIETHGYIFLILGTIMKYINFSDFNFDTETELASKLLFYINENYKKDISLYGLSKIFGYSESYISRYFKSNLNIGISEYVTVIRLKNAISLLCENKHSIAFCAMESGFTSIRTFYRAFNQEFGCSPKEYVKNIQYSN